ncbi:MAG: tyrosine-protein phosphatase [Rhodobacteraceae bacterium]|nr:tyrosine-protein phosphatase [Paracoccaceae bacterium]
MFGTIHAKLKAWQNRLGERFGTDISTPEARRAAWWHFQLSDHAFLRVWWHNFHRVAPGLYRANQPDGKRLADYAALGVKSVLNLRGPSGQSFWLFEREACQALGLPLHDLSMSARSLPTPEKLLQLHELFQTLPRPILVHCKSGADRTGLAAALWLIWIEGRTVEEAMGQLSLRYIHLSFGKTGILDHFLRYYARERDRSGIGLLDWIRKGYDPAEVTASYARWQAGGKEGAW